MKQSIITFRGKAAIPSICFTLTRVNRGSNYFFSLMQTGHLQAGRAFSPLNDIAPHLLEDMDLNSINKVEN